MRYSCAIFDYRRVSKRLWNERTCFWGKDGVMLRSQHWGNPSSSHYYGVQVASGGPIGGRNLSREVGSIRNIDGVRNSPSQQLRIPRIAWFMMVGYAWQLGITWHDSCKEKHRLFYFVELPSKCVFSFIKTIPRIVTLQRFRKAKKAIETARRRWLNSAEFPYSCVWILETSCCRCKKRV